MKQTALLSGYVFQWNMKKGGWAVYVFSILAGVITAVYRGYAGMAGETSPYRAKGFLPYELIIDQSMIPLFFGIGLLALLFLQFLQLRKYQKESKGIYTFLTLPMKGTQVANAFLLQSLAMVFLYYALWLMVIVVMYFPMMHWMVSLAAKQEFLMNDGTILTGIDATRHNGLFLAFLRSEFLEKYDVCTVPAVFCRCVDCIRQHAESHWADRYFYLCCRADDSFGAVFAGTQCRGDEQYSADWKYPSSCCRRLAHFPIAGGFSGTSCEIERRKCDEKMDGISSFWTALRFFGGNRRYLGKRLESHLERTVGIAASEGGSERISRFEYTVWDHRCEAEMEFFHQGWRFAERILYPVL